MISRRRTHIFVVALVAFLFATAPAFTQSINFESAPSPASINLNRSRGQNMLNEIKDVLKQRYYDKNFRGIDIDARFKVASERVKKLDTNWQIFRAIAQVLLEFDDSHTRFYPPGRANRVEYGFTTQMIGPNCFVTDVKVGSNAEAKGLKAGDRVLMINEFSPTRDNLWLINYLFYSLDPRMSISVTAAGGGEAERKLEITSTFKSIKEREKEAEKNRKEKTEKPYKCHSFNSETVACRLDTFIVEKQDIDKIMEEASRHKKLILDLRGNRGGYVHIEEYLVGHFFDRDVKIADFITRDKKKERVAKMKKERNFQGELIVLIDSNSASASEVFARVIQLEKRGKVIGDVSAGAVMTSNQVTMANFRGVPGYETYSVYGMNVTVSDLIMSDGNRLEKVGVIPDEAIGPMGAALFSRSDPVLAYAARLFGATISPDAAGKLNFLYKKDEGEADHTEKEDS